MPRVASLLGKEYICFSYNKNVSFICPNGRVVLITDTSCVDVKRGKLALSSRFSSDHSRHSQSVNLNFYLPHCSHNREVSTVVSSVKHEVGGSY